MYMMIFIYLYRHLKLTIKKEGVIIRIKREQRRQKSGTLFCATAAERDRRVKKKGMIFMKGRMKQLALTLAAAMLFSIMLTSCGGSGGGGGGSSVPKPTTTPGGTVTPGDDTKDGYTADAASKTITANDGSWTIAVAEDGTITKENVVDLSDLGDEKYAVTSDEITKENGTITVVRTLAVPRSALDSGNEAVNALVMMALDDAETVYATFTFVYDLNGNLLSVTVEYEGASVRYESDGAGGLDRSDAAAELPSIFEAILGAADEEQIETFLLELAEDAYADAEAGIAIVEKEFGGNEDETAIIASGECGAEGSNVTWKLDENGTLTISGGGEMDNDYYYTPWYEYRKDIVRAVVEVGVTSVDAWAFCDCTNMVSVVLPDGLQKIGTDAFYNCKTLTDITIPESVTEIDPLAFQGCSSLTEIFIPAKVETIGGDTFAECINLTNIFVDEENQYLMSQDGVLFNKEGTYLYNCPEAKGGNYTVPDGVTWITSKSFWDCEDLTSITIPDSVTTIGWLAFGGCSGLTKIIVPESVTCFYDSEMGAAVFNGCDKLKSAGPIGSGCNYEFGWKDTIPNGAFTGCYSMTTVYIPKGIAKIEEQAFRDCEQLTDIYYEGAQEEWAAIEISEYNEALTSAKIHYNSVA